MNLINIIFSLVALGGIAYLFLWRFKQYRIDRFRQTIFEIRHDLFDYAAHGNINFDHPAYIDLRNVLNGYIRFSHRISLLHLLLHQRYTHDRSIENFETHWRRHFTDLSPEAQARLEGFYVRSCAQLFYFVFLSSVAKKIVVSLFLFALIFQRRSKKKPVIVSPEKSGLTVKTYQFTESRSEQIKHSINHLNGDAMVFGRMRRRAVAI